MSKPILAALQALLTHKKSTTYAEIASVSGKKKIDVLNTLNKNEKLIIQKAGKITGLVDKEQEQRNNAYALGLTYILRKETFMGHYIDTKNKKAIDELGETRFVMDSQVTFIPNENGNLPKVEEMGIIASNTYKVSPFSSFWDE